MKISPAYNLVSILTERLEFPAFTMARLEINSTGSSHLECSE